MKGRALYFAVINWITTSLTSFPPEQVAYNEFILRSDEPRKHRTADPTEIQRSLNLQIFFILSRSWKKVRLSEFINKKRPLEVLSIGTFSVFFLRNFDILLKFFLETKNKCWNKFVDNCSQVARLPIIPLSHKRSATLLRLRLRRWSRQPCPRCNSRLTTAKHMLRARHGGGGGPSPEPCFLSRWFYARKLLLHKSIWQLPGAPSQRSARTGYNQKAHQWPIKVIKKRKDFVKAIKNVFWQLSLTKQIFYFYCIEQIDKPRFCL